MAAQPKYVGNHLWFPDPDLADPEGLVAFGGEMTVSRLLLAYSTGVFPWTADPVTWWSPDPRAIIELDELHVPRSLAKVLNRGRFSVTINKAFVEVMHGCAEPARGRGETWFSPEFLQAYHRLHIAGHAHSLECWTDNQHAGGIYGVAIGGFFAGESMFHRVSDASKVALYHLVCHLRARGFELFDIQMLTPVTKALGGRNIPRTDYLARLKKAISAPGRF